ncbi:stereocilin-like [Arapaima gigas]
MVCSQSKQLRSSASLSVPRRDNGSALQPDGPGDPGDPELSPQEWIKRMQLLTVDGTTPAPLTDSALQDSKPSVSFEVLRTLLAFYRPVLTQSFMEVLPGALVCILSDRDDCGAEADVTRGLSAQIQAPMRSILSSVQKTTCELSMSNTKILKTPSLLNLLNTGDSTLRNLASLQDFVMSSLVDIPKYVPEYVVSGWSLFVDVTFPSLMKYISNVIVDTFQRPADYVKSALQFFIKVPDLNQTEQCVQVYPHVLFRGMNHNVSWSFGDSVLDIFLAPETSTCSYPSLDCQSTHSGLFTRTLLWPMEAPIEPLECDHLHLASFTHTFCAELLSTDLQDSDMLSSFCKALSSLSSTETERVWKNGCLFARSLLSPVLNESACGGDSFSLLDAAASRSTLSLSQLLCNYKNWTNGNHVDPALVTLCSDNDRKEFVQVVCHNVTLLLLLVADANNAWLWSFCANFSADSVVDLYCTYDTWRLKMVDTSLISFCWEQDHDRLQRKLCFDLDFYMRFFADPQNFWILLNCDNLEPPTSLDISNEVGSSCQYSHWSQPALMSMDVLQMCILQDSVKFVLTVCSNVTFLNAILQNKLNAWIGDHCAIALSSMPAETPPAVSIKDWCRYGDWGVKGVDPSVIGFCWEKDQVSFIKNVCCIMSLYEKLILDPQNLWLTVVCSDKEMLNVLPQVCRYDEWISPTIVDMTDLALCTELDPQNFTQKVCTNAVVLRNLLANLDNTWLLQYCVNHSDPRGGNYDGPAGFKSDELCHYQSWAVMLPDADLLSFCWNYDQANFLSSICKDSTLLSLLSQEPSSMWVNNVCPTYTSTSNSSTASNASGSTTNSCPARDFVQRLNWSCSTDFSAACQPDASQTLGLQLILRCSMEMLQSRIGAHLTKEVSALLTQATRELVVVLLALEERQMTSLRITENIRLSVLESVMLYLEQETNFTSKRALLQCFGKVLTSLMQTGRDLTRDSYFLIKEYFRIPMSSLQDVLRATDVTTVRQILLYFSRNQDTLQLSTDYMQTMVTVFFQTHLVGDPSLFPDLAPLLSQARPTDILALPPIQSNTNVIKTINNKLNSLTLEQRRAFGKWFSQPASFLNMTVQRPSFIKDVGNLITYLPFSSFQHLSPAQLLDGLDEILKNPLSSTQEQFVAQSIVGFFTNLTADDFRRLGNLTCLSHPKDLLVYRNTEAFAVIQDNVRTCVSQGLRVPSDMISSLFFNRTELKVPASLSPERVQQLADFLPWLGADFLRQLTPSQLLPALPKLAAVPFTPAQLEVAEQLSRLGSLISGVKVETLRDLPIETLLSALPNINLHDISNSQANAITTKLWGSQGDSGWMDQLEPLLSRTPLLNVLPRVTVLLANMTSARQRPWNTQQKRCIIEELYQFTFFSQLLGELGSQIALELLVSSIKKFPVLMMDTLRQMIVQDPDHFLRLPSIKQALLVDKMTQRLSLYTGKYTEEEFRSLGIMATFVADEVFLQLDRTFFVENLELIREYCYNSSKKDIVAQFLQEPNTFGSVKNWNSQTLDQVDRFLFFLSKEAIQAIPTTLMTQERIERLFLSQHEWEIGKIGRLCIQGTDQAELQRMFEKQEFVLQFFLGFLRSGWSMMVPSCENLHATQPSAWTVDSLTGMPADAFARCLELIGQDPFLTPYELTQLLSKIYGPASSFSPTVISQLRRIALRLTDEELRLLNLSDLRSIATLGAVDGWSTRQAVLWLGHLRLLCSDEQLQVLVGLLSNNLAFGHMSSWGPEVFIEIGSFAAGLPDMAMSALVKEQIEGITPLAISLIPDKKFAVVFNQAQIRMFTYEQAVAVTDTQRSALSTVQQTALAMVLTPWEDKPVDFRGNYSSSTTPSCCYML